jgi:hypothetical protein
LAELLMAQWSFLSGEALSAELDEFEPPVELEPELIEAEP